MRELIDFLKSKIPLKDMVEEYVPPGSIERAGRQYACRCPLPGHDERTASFTIYPDNHFYCFGCRTAGDVIKFILLIEQKGDPNFHFRDAIHRLKTQCIDWGLATDEDFAKLGELDLTAAEVRVNEHWSDLLAKHGYSLKVDSPIKCNRLEHMRRPSDAEAHARDELPSTPSKAKDRFEVREDDDSGLDAKLRKYQRRLRDHRVANSYLEERGISMETADRLGLGWSEREHGIVFPVRDEKGRALGYQVRIVPEDRDE